MFLSHKTIEKLIKGGEIVVEPSFDFADLRPVGIRIHLAEDILVPEDGQTIDLQNPSEPRYKQVSLGKEEFYLEPGQFILGATRELIKTPANIVGLLDGRSTIARIGLTIHVTASIIEGIFGRPHSTVLEIKNLGNFRVRLRPKDPIGMMCFATLSEAVDQPTQSQYEVQDKVTPPNLMFKTGTDK